LKLEESRVIPIFPSSGAFNGLPANRKFLNSKSDHHYPDNPMVRRQTFTARMAMTRGERSGLADDGALDVLAETAYDIRTTGRTVDELTCSSGHFLKILRFLLDSPQKSRFSSPPRNNHFIPSCHAFAVSEVPSSAVVGASIVPVSPRKKAVSVVT